MTISRGFQSLEHSADSRTVARVFADELEQLNLTRAQIQAQSLDELEQSLQRVNDAIQKADTYGKRKVQLGPMTKGGDRVEYEVGILPALLAGKQLILERMRQLKGEYGIDQLRGLLQNAPQDVRADLEDQLEKIQSEARELEEEAQEVEAARRQQELDEQERLALWQVELTERRAKIWQAFLQRESVATILGAVLLVLLTSSLILAMFTGVEATDIVGNAFLLILGYFFGQAASRVRAGEEQE